MLLKNTVCDVTGAASARWIGKAACDASDSLKKEGFGVRVVDMYSVSPLDRDAIRHACADHWLVVTAEEHNVTGGFGSAVADVIAEEGLGAKLVKIGMPDTYSVLGPPTHLYAHYGLDGEGVAKRVRENLAESGRKAHRAATTLHIPNCCSFDQLGQKADHGNRAKSVFSIIFS